MKLSVVDWVERFGLGLAQFKVILTSGGIWMADGAELLLISSVTKALADEWDLTAVERGSVVSIVFIGVLCGNMLSGHLGDQFGRKIPVLASYIAIFVFSLFSAMAVDFYMLICLRFFVGAAFGLGQPSAGALAAEVMPMAWRILPQVMGQAMFPIGEMYSGLLVAIDDPQMRELDWRWLITMGALPSLILGLYAYYELHESPMWLKTQPNRESEAAEVLGSMRRANLRWRVGGTSLTDLLTPTRSRGKHDQLYAAVEGGGGGDGEAAADEEEVWHGPIEIASTKITGSPGSPADRLQDNSTTGDNNNKNTASLGLLRKVFSYEYASSTIVLCWTTFTLNFVYYGGLYAFPQLLEGIGDTLTVSPAVSLVLAAVCEIPGCVIALLLGLYCFRKPALVLSLLLCCLSTGLFIGGASLVAKAETKEVVQAIAEPDVPGYSPPVPGVDWEEPSTNKAANGLSSGKLVGKTTASAGADSAPSTPEVVAEDQSRRGLAPEDASAGTSTNTDGGPPSASASISPPAAAAGPATRTPERTTEQPLVGSPGRDADSVPVAVPPSKNGGESPTPTPPVAKPRRARKDGDASDADKNNKATKNIWDEKTQKFRSNKEPAPKDAAAADEGKKAEKKSKKPKKYVATVAGPVYKGQNNSTTANSAEEGENEGKIKVQDAASNRGQMQRATPAPKSVEEQRISDTTLADRALVQERTSWLVQFFNLAIPQPIVTKTLASPGLSWSSDALAPYTRQDSKNAGQLVHLQHEEEHDHAQQHIPVTFLETGAIETVHHNYAGDQVHVATSREDQRRRARGEDDQDDGIIRSGELLQQPGEDASSVSMVLSAQQKATSKTEVSSGRVLTDSEAVIGDHKTTSQQATDSSTDGDDYKLLANFFLQAGLFGNKIWVQVCFVLIYLYSVEAYPTQYRNSGAAVCLAAGRIGAISCPLIYELLPHQFYFFVIMASLLAINCFFFVFFRLPETAGQPLAPDDSSKARQGYTSLLSVPFAFFMATAAPEKILNASRYSEG
ncbi:unnamed protein product [Amoebophrya sp. A120]|nr:unnamed protein product [Amoebophrya sp. A120]|eukprot:GSA120T00001602001.1